MARPKDGYYYPTTISVSRSRSVPNQRFNTDILGEVQGIWIKPEHVSHRPEHVIYRPEHVTYTPEHVTLKPEHVTHNSYVNYRPSNTGSTECTSADTGLQQNTQKYKWPMLNTQDKERIKKEKTLHSLMTEIDDLMHEVGLTDRKLDSTVVTYEVFTRDSERIYPENHRTQTAAVSPKQTANIITFNATKRIKRDIKSMVRSDSLVVELEQLLADCDADGGS